MSTADHKRTWVSSSRRDAVDNTEPPRPMVLARLLMSLTQTAMSPLECFTALPSTHMRLWRIQVASVMPTKQPLDGKKDSLTCRKASQEGLIEIRIHA